MSVDGRLVVALVRGIRGLRGTIRVEVLTDRTEERFAPGSVLYPEGTARQLTVSWSAPVADGPGWWLRFEEVPDRTAAEPLMGTYLETGVGPADTLGRGEYYWHELIGVAVTNVDGTALGTVRDVYRAGGAEVFVVGGGPLGSFDVPAVRDYVRILAPRRGEIVVDAGALDLDLARLPAERGGTAPGPATEAHTEPPADPPAEPAAEPR